MNIYVDFDDCLCETAKYFSLLAKEMFGRNIPYENIKDFNLQKSFSLNDDEYSQMMIHAHLPQELLSYKETPHACETIKSWLQKGYDVKIITGRPVSAYEPSRQWLNFHGLEKVPLYCLNKYGRENFLKGSSFNLELEDYYKMHFDYAVEDSPAAFKFFEHLPELKILVFNRPWNQKQLPEKNYKRCYDWKMIAQILEAGEGNNGN